MPQWFKILIATILPLIAGALAWIICVVNGVDGDTTGIVVGLVVVLPATPIGLWAAQLSPAAPAQPATGGADENNPQDTIPPEGTENTSRQANNTDSADTEPPEPSTGSDTAEEAEPEPWHSSTVGHIVEQSVRLDIDIDPDGWATLVYHHELLNLSDAPLTRIARELWFENTRGPLTIEPTDDSERRLMIQRIHDTANLTKFACQLSPPLQPGESTIVGFTCQGGQFVEDHYWRQAINRPTRRYTINVRHRGAGQLTRCTAVEDNADGSQRSADDSLVWDFDGDDIMISLTRERLHPNQAVTLRWDKPN